MIICLCKNVNLHKHPQSTNKILENVFDSGLQETSIMYWRIRKYERTKDNLRNRMDGEDYGQHHS